MAHTFDPKCWELACHFLADQPGATDEDRTELALDLQDTAEEFFLVFAPSPTQPVVEGGE